MVGGGSGGSGVGLGSGLIDPEREFTQEVRVKLKGYGRRRDMDRQVQIVEKELRLQFGSSVVSVERVRSMEIENYGSDQSGSL
jgi:hypothetical protein